MELTEEVPDSVYEDYSQLTEQYSTINNYTPEVDASSFSSNVNCTGGK